MKIAILTLALLVIISVPVLAADFPKYQDKYVNDFAGVLDAGQASQLRSLLAAVEQNNTARVVVVTVNTLEGMAPSQYATELATLWGVGRSDVDNGMLILYAKTENKIFAATGYGLEGILSDSKIGRLLDEYYVPQRDVGNVSKGILDLSQAIAGVLQGDSSYAPAEEAIPPEAIVYIVFLAIIFMAVIAFAAKKSSQKCDVCGQRMKLVKAEGAGWGSDYVYYSYQCPNGHRKRVKRRKNRGVWIAGAGAGGFGGGGFGGGGFGGGGFGGGGAGR